MSLKRLPVLAGIPLAALVMTACGGGDTPTVQTVTVPAPAGDDNPDPATTAEAGQDADQAPITAAPADAGGSTITSHLDAQPAVIQIRAQGGMRDPEFGNYVGGGSGSGFLISSDGLAITNNHVVTGAATLEVFIGGDTTRSYNARVIGASECNDLALIDISEAEPLPYLDWSQSPVAVGQEIYVAGYPLGSPEYTLTRGIVSKANAHNEDLSWASVDHSMEHDANAHPGNSGGPLLGPDGRITGVHFAGYLPDDMVRQQFAIDHLLAQNVLSHLQEGDYESLGINAMPVYDQSLDVTGLWVSGVKPGTPAARAKVVPGDIITTLNGLPMAPNGTMTEYCDVLRTAGENAPMAIEVLRWDTGEVLRGELNNPNEQDAAMSPVMSFYDEIGDEVADGGGEEYTYDRVVDDSESIVVEVPSEWTDRRTGLNSTTGLPAIEAAIDLDAFQNTWEGPGLMYVQVETREDLGQVIDDMGFAADCVDDGRSEYSDGLFTGYYNQYSKCGGSDNQIVALAATPTDGSFTALMVVQMIYDRDVLALDQAFATFNYFTG